MYRYLKWFKKLSKKDALVMHAYVINGKVDKKCQINKKDGICIFYEGGWGDGWQDDNYQYIPTSYEYDDFSVKPWDTYGDEENMNQRYFRWMAIHFGKEYLLDFISYKTGIETEFFADCFNKKEDK